MEATELVAGIIGGLCGSVGGGGVMMMLLKDKIGRLADLEREVQTDLSQRVKSLENKIPEDLTGRVSKLEQQNNEDAEFRGEIKHLRQQLQKLDPGAITTSLEVVGRQVRDLEGKVDGYQAEVIKHTERLENLAARQDGLHKKVTGQGRELGEIRSMLAHQAGVTEGTARIKVRRRRMDETQG